jgi:hypothetical protein
MKTQDALRAYCQKHQRPWSEVINDMAQQGNSWADIAHELGVKSKNIQAYCHYRGLQFDWPDAAQRKEKYKQRQKRKEQGLPAHYVRYYTAFGITDTLDGLSARYGKKERTVYNRMARDKMTLENALTTPIMSASERGKRGHVVLMQHVARRHL